MEYQYFIASRWRNKDQVLELTKKIRAVGKTVYCFLEGDGEAQTIKNLAPDHDPEAFMQELEQRPDWQRDPEIKKIFDVDMNALKASAHIILLLPAGKSAHLEAGAAYGLGKELSLIGEQKEAESLYLIFNHCYRTIDEFIQSLTESTD